jgi:hypothetical protein
VKDVDFETIWGLAHTTAEDEGESYATSNFISWVEKCVKALVTGIKTVDSSANATEVARYSLSGMRISQPTRGINLIKMSDGTVKKVLLK